MVLKRFYLMAFAGLTVGGMAWGQGTTYNDIPAPDLYGDITGCVSTTPKSLLEPAKSGANKGKSTLDVALEDGTMALASTGAGAITAGMLTPCATNTNSVSEGIAQARILYREAAQARSAAMIEGASQDAIDDYNEAKAERDAYGGAVYDKVYSESMAQAAAAKAIRDYNVLFRADDATTSDVDESGVYTKAVADFSALVLNNLDVDDQGNALDVTADDYVNTYGKDQIRGVQAIAGFSSSETVAVYDPATEYTWGSAFDASGKLTFAENDLEATETATNNGADGNANILTLGQLKTYLDGWNALVRATEKAVADTNPETADPAMVARYRQDAARAKVARDHAQAEWDRLTADLRRVDREPAGTTSDSDKLDAFANAERAVSRNGSNVRTTLGALESATKALSDSLTSADDFLSQVVSSAKYAQSNLAEDATEGQVDAAAKAVMDAEAAVAAHMALTGDPDNPAVALLDALLEPDVVQGKDNPADDDGQALIDAISATYDVAKSASDDAREVINELTGEGGKIEEIETKLAAKKEYIENIAGEVGIDPMTGEGTMEGGYSRIDMNEMRSTENRSMIMTNTENIATNAGNIAMNASGVMTNAGNIADNAAAIGMNSGAITSLNNRVGSNESAIMRNSGMISELQDEMEVVRAGVAASMALAGMPAINGRGVSIGIGSYAGESAFAVGFQIQGEMASFKVGVTSAGGETGASAGVGFQF